jgi:hypothetical protein
MAGMSSRFEILCRTCKIDWNSFSVPQSQRGIVLDVRIGFLSSKCAANSSHCIDSGALDETIAIQV